MSHPANPFKDRAVPANVAGDERCTNSPLATGENAAKSLANMKAAFALAGHAVHDLAEGGFLVIRPAWNGVRRCRDLHALRAFARMVGVP